MNTKWLLVALMTSYLAGPALTSPQPIPAPGKPSQKEKSEHSRESRATASEDQRSQLRSPPPPLKVSPKTQVVAANSNKKESEKSTTDWWVTIFTGVLAVVAFLQLLAMVRQSKYMRDALEESRRTVQANDALSRQALEETRLSNAATEKSNEIARKALIYGKRSWLIPEVDESSLFKDGERWKVVFYVSNTGSVPGVMINAHARIDSDPDFGTAPPQMFGSRGSIILPGSGKEGALRITAEVPDGIPEEKLLTGRGGSLCVYIAITYKDIVLDEFETGERETKVSWLLGQDRRWYNNNFFEIRLT